MKIYTKGGDQGETSLLLGQRVPKHHLRLEAYGSLDELNAWLGYFTTCEVLHAQHTLIKLMQEHIFIYSSYLACESEEASFLPPIPKGTTEHLEIAIDEMQSKLPELRHFILPGGDALATQVHIARTVCRRAERMLSLFSTAFPLPDGLMALMNRLSDYLFVLSRFAQQASGTAEVYWNPKRES
jgi:cob(I)alamin adenosyltransferase